MDDPADPDRPAENLARLVGRLSSCADLDGVIDTSLGSLAELFGWDHSLLLLLDEAGHSLYTIASHGYEPAGVGSEVGLDHGAVGMAASQRTPVRVGNVQRMLFYARRIRRGYEETIGPVLAAEIPLPGLAKPQSQLAAPAILAGELIGVLAIESEVVLAYDAGDEAILSVVATMLASSIELDRARGRSETDREATEPPVATSSNRFPTAQAVEQTVRVRYYTIDGSTFLNDEYLIKGVPGRILWKLLCAYQTEGRREFTNKEVRLDPALELPAYRDNLESRLILLRRRLAERPGPLRLETAGRGRFRLSVDQPLHLQQIDTTRH
jgi:adenylate cyclase